MHLARRHALPPKCRVDVGKPAYQVFQDGRHAGGYLRQAELRGIFGDAHSLVGLNREAKSGAFTVWVQVAKDSLLKIVLTTAIAASHALYPQYLFK